MNCSRIVAALVVLLLLCTTVGAGGQQRAWTAPPSVELANLVREAKDQADTIIGDDAVKIYVSRDSTVVLPEHATKSLRLLVDVVKQQARFSEPLLPLDIIVLPYEDYVRYSVWFAQNIVRLRPDWQFAVDPRFTSANFMPVPEFDRNIILTYVWEWNTILHELCHVGIMRQWSSDAAVAHTIIFEVQGIVMRTDAYLGFLVSATRK